MKYTAEIQCQGKIIALFGTIDVKEFNDKVDELFNKNKDKLVKAGFKPVHDCWNCNGKSVVVYYHDGKNEARALSLQVIKDTELKDIDGKNVCIWDKIALVGEDGQVTTPIYEMSMTGGGELYLWRIDRLEALNYEVTQQVISQYRKVDERTVESLKLKNNCKVNN